MEFKSLDRCKRLACLMMFKLERLITLSYQLIIDLGIIRINRKTISLVSW